MIDVVKKQLDLVKSGSTKSYVNTGVNLSERREKRYATRQEERKRQKDIGTYTAWENDVSGFLTSVKDYYGKISADGFAWDDNSSTELDNLIALGNQIYKGEFAANQAVYQHREEFGDKWELISDSERYHADLLGNALSGLTGIRDRKNLSAEFTEVSGILDAYDQRLGKGEALNEQEIAEYQNAANAFINIGGKLFTAENGYDNSVINQFQKAHPHVAAAAASISDLSDVNQWKEINKGQEYNGMLDVDIDALRSEIGRIDEEIASIDESDFEQATYDEYNPNDPDSVPAPGIPDVRNEYAAIVVDLEEEKRKKKLLLKEAEYAQTKFSYEKESRADSNFDRYVDIGKALEESSGN